MNPSPYRAGPTDPTAATHWPIEPSMLSSTHELAGYRVARTLGVVHGFGHASAGMQLGVAIDQRVVQSHEQAHATAVVAMMRQAVDAGANAIVGVRYEFGHWSDGSPVALAFGTAARAEAA